MKKFIILLLIALPMSLMAQDGKIAFVDVNDVFEKMPEMAKIRTDLSALNDKYTRELKDMQDEYQRKTAAYLSQQDSLTENIKLRRMQEIEDIRAKTENFVGVAQQEMEKARQEAFKPVQEKMMKAINDVGTEKGYTYIIDPQVLLYHNPSTSVDATSFVKAKLGIQ